eukprot:3566749-Amphidinium_carterae.1
MGRGSLLPQLSNELTKLKASGMASMRLLTSSRLCAVPLQRLMFSRWASILARYCITSKQCSALLTDNLVNTLVYPKAGTSDQEVAFAIIIASTRLWVASM